MGDRTWMTITVPAEHYELHKKEFESGGRYGFDDGEPPLEDGLKTLMYYEINYGGDSMREEMKEDKIPHLFSHGSGGNYSGYYGVFLPGKLDVEMAMTTGGSEAPAFDPHSSRGKGVPSYQAMAYVLAEFGEDEFMRMYASKPPVKTRVAGEDHRCFDFIGRYGDTILSAMRMEEWKKMVGLHDEHFRLTLYERIATMYQIWQDMPMPSRAIPDAEQK